MSPSTQVLYDVRDQGFASVFLIIVFVTGTIVAGVNLLVIIPLVRPNLAQGTGKARLLITLVVVALLGSLVTTSHLRIVRAKYAIEAPSAQVIEGVVSGYHHPVASETVFTVAGHEFRGTVDPLSATYGGVPRLKDGTKVRITYSDEGVLRVEDLTGNRPVTTK